MEIKFETRFNIGDTAYQLIGTSVYQREITSVHYNYRGEDKQSISYGYNNGVYSLVHEEELFGSVEEIRNSITLVQEKTE